MCPRLLTVHWRKNLYKFTDILLEVPAGARDFWPANMHEPLLIGLTFRLLLSPPWLLKCHPSLLDMGGALRRVWQDRDCNERPFLRQLYALPDALDGLS